MFKSVLLDTLPNILAIGNTSVIPIRPPNNSAVVSVRPPTSSPISLAICSLSPCAAIPVGIAKAVGAVNVGDRKPLAAPGAFARALPTIPAPKKGTNDPTPSPSFVENLSAYRGSAANAESCLSLSCKPSRPLYKLLSLPISNKPTIPVGTSKAKLAIPLGIALPNSFACSSADV